MFGKGLFSGGFRAHASATTRSREPRRRSRASLVESLESRRLFASVTTFHNDNANLGANIAETTLTPDNVNAATFGKVAEFATDSAVQAQPLYVPNVTIGSSTYNVLIVATTQNSVYAFDASTGTTLWHKTYNTFTNGVNNYPGTPVDGIQSTPVVSGNTIYFVTKAKFSIVSADHYIFEFHGVNVTNGVEVTNSPVTIGDTINIPNTYTGTNNNYDGSIYGAGKVSGPSVHGSGAGSSGGYIQFNAVTQRQRTGLTLANGNVYFGFSADDSLVGDETFDTKLDYHGWVLGYSTSSMSIAAAVNVTPGGNGGGIWQSTVKIAADSQSPSNLYLETGNGTFDTTLSSGFPTSADYGNSIIKLSVDSTHNSSGNQNVNGWGLKVADYFTPHDQAILEGQDLDLASAGPVLLPDADGSSAHPHLMVASGKQGVIYLIDRDNMGHYNSTADQIVAEVVGFDNASPGATGDDADGDWGAPAYLNHTLYYVGSHGSAASPFLTDRAQAFSISNANLTKLPATSIDTYGYGGATPSVSANGATAYNAIDGIVWMLDKADATTRDQYDDILVAYDASDLTRRLYSSDDAAGHHDAIDYATGQSFGSRHVLPFALPTIAAGKVYVPTGNAIVVYGLINTANAGIHLNPANAGFEAGVTGGWTASYGHYSTNSANARHGTYAGVIDNGLDSALSQILTGLKPNTTYTLSAWAKVDAGYHAYIGVKSYGGNEQAVNMVSTSYAEGSIVFTTGPTNTSATIYFYEPAGSGTGHAYVDDFTLTPILPADASFESGNLSAWGASYPNSGPSVPSVVVGTATAHAGSYAGLVSAGQAIQQTLTNLTPSTTYTLSGWAKVVTSGDSVAIGVTNYGGGADVAATITSMTYSQGSVTFTTGPSSTTATIYAYKSSGGSAYVDDFNLYVNPAADPGFESGALAGWSGSYGAVSVDDTNPHTGTYAAKVVATATPSAASRLITGLVPSTTYTLSGWAKVDTSGESIAIGVTAYGAADVSTAIASTTYTQGTVTFTTGPKSTSAYIYAYKSSGTGAAYVDDFVVTQALPANAGFESGPTGAVGVDGTPGWRQSYGNFSIVNDGNAHNGNYEVRIDSTSLPSAAQQLVTGLAPSTTYTLSAWIKRGTASTVSLGVTSMNSASTFTTSTMYVNASVTFTTGASETSVVIFLYSGSGGTAFGDDFSIT